MTGTLVCSGCSLLSLAQGCVCSDHRTTPKKYCSLLKGKNKLYVKISVIPDTNFEHFVGRRG